MHADDADADGGGGDDDGYPDGDGDIVMNAGDDVVDFVSARLCELMFAMVVLIGICIWVLTRTAV